MTGSHGTSRSGKANADIDVGNRATAVFARRLFTCLDELLVIPAVAAAQPIEVAAVGKVNAGGRLQTWHATEPSHYK